jgi:hypothetical protein
MCHGHREETVLLIAFIPKKPKTSIARQQENLDSRLSV